MVEVRPLKIGPWPLKRSTSDKSSDGRRPRLELLTYSINEPGLSKVLARIDEEAVLIEDIVSKGVLASTDVEKGDKGDDYISARDLEWATRFCNILYQMSIVFALLGPMLNTLLIFGASFYYYDPYSSFLGEGTLPGLVMVLLYGFFTSVQLVLVVFVMRWTTMVKAGLTGSREVSGKLAMREARWVIKGLQATGQAIFAMMIMISIALLIL